MTSHIKRKKLLAHQTSPGDNQTKRLKPTHAAIMNSNHNCRSRSLESKERGSTKRRRSSLINEIEPDDQPEEMVQKPSEVNNLSGAEGKALIRDKNSNNDEDMVNIEKTENDGNEVDFSDNEDGGSSEHKDNTNLSCLTDETPENDKPGGADFLYLREEIYMFGKSEVTLEEEQVKEKDAIDKDEEDLHMPAVLNIPGFLNMPEASDVIESSNAINEDTVKEREKEEEAIANMRFSLEDFLEESGNKINAFVEDNRLRTTALIERLNQLMHEIEQSRYSIRHFETKAERNNNVEEVNVDSADNEQVSESNKYQEEGNGEDDNDKNKGNVEDSDTSYTSQQQTRLHQTILIEGDFIVHGNLYNFK